MQNALYFIKRYAKEIILYLLVLACIIFCTYIMFFKKETKPSIQEEIATIEQHEEVSYESKDNLVINIDIKGAVKKPGVYQVSNNAIVDDVIKLAGGFNTNAYQNGINMSKKVKDEMVIYVYTKAEIKDFYSKEPSLTISNETCKAPDYSICECVNNKESIIEVGSNNEEIKKDDTPSGTKVNINTASLTELATLSGIGESKAQAIITYREENGKFAKIEDLMNVSGIGEKSFEKIKDSITI